MTDQLEQWRTRSRVAMALRNIQESRMRLEADERELAEAMAEANELGVAFAPVGNARCAIVADIAPACWVEYLGAIAFDRAWLAGHFGPHQEPVTSSQNAEVGR